MLVKSVRNRKQKSRKQIKKENQILLKKAYLDDPEYRAFLMKMAFKEDKDMQEITDNLAKLFQD